jgi:uncharacterized protein
MSARPLRLELEDGRGVSALLDIPPDAQACYVFAHGAGAGMAHPFMSAVAKGLAERAIATLRYQFLYMEQKSKRPDPPRLAHAAVRAAVAKAADLVPQLPLFAGGKSFGGRMTSQAQAFAPLPGVQGLVFLGFPLHAAGKPSDERGAHLLDVGIPMLFLQGTRDALAELAFLEPVVKRVRSSATLETFDAADHSFHVPARSGRNDSDVMTWLVDHAADWMKQAKVS